jgi:hypothetical protein
LPFRANILLLQASQLNAVAWSALPGPLGIPERLGADAED